MKNVLITGSSSGIGAEIARLFSENEYHVHLHGRDSSRLEMIAHKLAGPSTIHQVDLSDEKALSFWLDRLVEDEEGLDCLVNNAGIYTRQPVTELSMEENRRLFEVNYFTLVEISKRLYPLLKKAKGNVINMSSTAGMRPVQGIAAYCATKAAVNMFTETMSLEWAPDVRVNAICPGIVDTPIHQMKNNEEMNDFQPMKRIGTPRDVANLAWFLANDELSSWTTGTVMPVSGGIHLI